ncbi:conserved hypothetical protein [Paecilomyces variotii No. 5]|uniref:RING finger domain protein n=1 Tax=Byssochlamys spectabilis (strain No. 5 / NBRC 109023) TaxID=1356009 RepID=V5FMR5_BYSSN|nr:conserved hypothetical protein [Paecilomyces variotii No. 5]
MSDSHGQRSETPLDRHGEASSSSTPQHRLTLPPLPQTRFPGDGFDYRRPVMSSPQQAEDVIDLTNEPDSPPSGRSRHQGSGRPGGSSRPPRFGRNIMADVVDLEEEPEPSAEEEPPSSPEVQFVRATVRPQPPPRARSGFMGRSSLLDIMRLRSSRLPALLSREEAFRHEVALRARSLARPVPHGVDTFWIGDAPNEGIDLTIDLDVDVPLGMNYHLAGFTVENPSRPVPSYKPPTPPPEGFTRSAQEDEMVVCPNCGDELGIGDDTKQQIWVAKPCGHVYCGACAKNRSLSKSKKTSHSSHTKTKPFSKCQVEDCGKPVSAPKAMFQIYM